MLKEFIDKYKEERYWKKRARIWANFQDKEVIECGLDDHLCEQFFYKEQTCYREKFFNQYGCMYIKGFLDY